MPRIKQWKTKEDVGEAGAAEIDEIMAIAPHGVGDGAFGILTHSPGLALKAVELTMQCHKGTLDHLQQELAIIAVCREKDATRLWDNHVRNSRAIGMNESVIEAIRNRSDVSELEPDEQDMITYVRQLFQTNRVEQAVFDRLVQRHSEQWLVEFTALATQYSFLATIQNAFEVFGSADGEPLPN